VNEGISLNVPTAAAVSAILLAVVGALGTVFKLLITAKEAQINEWKERYNTAQKIADQAVAMCEVLAQRYGAGVQVPLLAPVIPSHNSPVSEAQKFAAESEALKARLAAAMLAVSKPPPQPGDRPLSPG